MQLTSTVTECQPSPVLHEDEDGLSACKRQCQLCMHAFCVPKAQGISLDLLQLKNISFKFPIIENPCQPRQAGQGQLTMHHIDTVSAELATWCKVVSISFSPSGASLLKLHESGSEVGQDRYSLYTKPGPVSNSPRSYGNFRHLTRLQ